MAYSVHGKHMILTSKTVMMHKLAVSLYVFMVFCFCACKSDTTKDGKTPNTPTTGELVMWSEDGLKPILTTSIDVFDSIYDRAKINVTYKDEADIVKALLDDSIEVGLITRNLTQTELDYFKQYGFTPKTTMIAYDAIAVILHPSNRDTVFTVGEMKDILSGKTTTWKQRNSNGPAGDIVAVFDHAGAGTVRYAKDSILMGEPMSPRANALKTNEEVLDYVSKNKGAIGLISANWISDTDDGGVQSFLKTIRIAEIGLEAGKESFTPHQAYLATGQYPFKRTIWYIDATARNFGLGVGFASFLAGDRGQRIILKSGLLPATMPLRLIKTSRE
jgi:phosphate transport system substrate-binding protein